MPVKLLATGDLHIGRRPTRVVEAAQADRCSAARMWELIVERAIAEQVDLVALSGDVVDHDNRFYEATGPLERGLRRLAGAGIDTVAVAGNHDFDVLPRLADLLGPERFHLLGRGGKWEAFDLVRGGQPVLQVHGWSFPELVVPVSPLASYTLPAHTSLPTLGIVHADLDVMTSRYAPVARAEFNRTTVSMWLLGHIHAPRWEQPAGLPALLYPGSPQALDPGEPGDHGPWLIEISGRQQISARQLCLSRIRYEALTLDLTGIQQLEEFDARWMADVNEKLNAWAAAGGPLELVSLRLTLTGSTPLYRELAESNKLEELESGLSLSRGGITLRVDRVFNLTRSETPLATLSERDDPPGILARLLLKLQSGETDAELAGLLEQTERKLQTVHRAGAYQQLSGDAAPDLSAARKHLASQAVRLLETLLEQEQVA